MIKTRLSFPWLLLWTACSPWSQGDIIHLTNGRTIEGSVVTQALDRITLDVGTGQIHLRRAQIASIETTDVARVEAAWRDRYFLHERFVPAGCTEVAARLRTLQDQRRSAETSVAEILRLRAEVDQLAQQIAAGHADRGARQARLAAVDTNAVTATREAWLAYGREVAAFNAAQARVANLVDRQQETTKRIGKAQAAESEYLRALAQAGPEIEQLAQTDGSSDERQRFLERARSFLSDCQSGVTRHETPASWENGHAMLEVQLNGRARGRFLLDTGASVVVLAEALARRAGATPDTNRTAQYQLADGRKVTGWPVILDSVQVGDARLARVAGVVLPSAPSSDFEGLLGMSFLREFTVRVDAASGRVELMRLQRPGR